MPALARSTAAMLSVPFLTCNVANRDNRGTAWDGGSPPPSWRHAELTCTVSPLCRARSLLFQLTMGCGLPTAVQVRLSASRSRTSTNAGGVTEKVGGAGKKNALSDVGKEKIWPRP